MTEVIEQENTNGELNASAQSIHELCAELEKHAAEHCNSFNESKTSAFENDEEGYWPKYYKRLESYQGSLDHFEVITPIKCAVYGWILDKTGELKCEDCLKTSELPQIPKNLIENEDNLPLAANFTRSLSEKHEKLCLWRCGQGKIFRNFYLAERLALFDVFTINNEVVSPEINTVLDKFKGKLPIRKTNSLVLAISGWIPTGPSSLNCRECLTTIDVSALNPIESQNPLAWHKEYCPIIHKSNPIWHLSLNNWLELQESSSMASNCAQILKELRTEESLVESIDEQPNSSMETARLNDEVAEKSFAEEENVKVVNEKADFNDPSQILVDENAFEMEKRAKYNVVMKKPDPVFKPESKKHTEVVNERKRKNTDENDEVSAKTLRTESTSSVSQENPSTLTQESSSAATDTAATDTSYVERPHIPKFPETPASPHYRPDDDASSDSEVILLSDNEEEQNDGEHDSEEDQDSQNDAPEDYMEDYDDADDEEENEVEEIAIRDEFGNSQDSQDSFADFEFDAETSQSSQDGQESQQQNVNNQNRQGQVQLQQLDDSDESLIIQENPEDNDDEIEDEEDEIDEENYSGSDVSDGVEDEHEEEGGEENEGGNDSDSDIICLDSD